MLRPVCSMTDGFRDRFRDPSHALQHYMSANEKPGVQTPTDSPWLWLAVFTFGAIIALVLMSPKFEGRQSQLERQYEARQAAGQSVSSDDDRSITHGGELIITLKPLFSFFVVLLFALTAAFWIGRYRQRRDSSHNGAIP